jgi:hypothetical protein
LQARALEDARQWQSSIQEYGLTGEQAPHAPNIARLRLQWGEQLLQQKRYRDAINLFYLASHDDESSVAVDDHSLNDLYATYKAWFATRADDAPLNDAASFFERDRLQTGGQGVSVANFL